jgi:hypothetical protein
VTNGIVTLRQRLPRGQKNLGSEFLKESKDSVDVVLRGKNFPGVASELLYLLESDVRFSGPSEEREDWNGMLPEVFRVEFSRSRRDVRE